MKIGNVKKTIIFFIALSSIVHASDVSDMKNEIKKLDKQLEVKHERIENIDNEKKEIYRQIEEIKKDITKISEENDKIKEEISTVSKNIDYSEKNLTFNSGELERKQSLFKAKIIAWSRKQQGYKPFDKDYILKKEFSKVLYSDTCRITKIKNVQKNIIVIKKEIEDQKRVLDNLNYQLRRKKNEIAAKQNLKNNLIAKLNSEKKNHIKTISKIEKQKREIEKQIEDIIKNRATVSKDVKFNEAKNHFGTALKPIQGPIVLGFKEYKNKNVRSNGIEIKGSLGKEIRSSLPGKVIYIDKLQGLGKVIMIDYGYNTIGVYGNTIGSKVKVNQKVKKGEVIGVLGYSTEGTPHLYYEVRFNLKPINPENLF